MGIHARNKLFSESQYLLSFYWSRNQELGKQNFCDMPSFLEVVINPNVENYTISSKTDIYQN